MSKKDTLKPIAAAIGAALVGTLSASVVNAADNPFGLQQLDSGYIQVADLDVYPQDEVQEAIKYCPEDCIYWEET